jgi:hypothetical protein
MKGLKLSNKQVEVLAEEIYKELEVEANKYKESDEYKNFEDTLKTDEKYKTLKKVNTTLDKARESGFLNDSYHVNGVTHQLEVYIRESREKSFKNEGKFPTKQSISNKIHLNTIDVDNLEDLINKVKNSLK